MPANVLVPILPGALPPQYCFTTWQQALVDFANAMKAVLPGLAYYNFGPDKPAPELQAYPWLRTVDGRWYRFDGNWVAPTNYTDLDRRWFPGTLVELQTYDGGDTGSPSDRSGPMWVEDTEQQGRVPVGP